MPRRSRSSGGGGIGRSYSSAKTAKAPAPGGGRRSYSSAKTTKAPAPAPAAKGGGAPAPATSSTGDGRSVLSDVGLSVLSDVGRSVLSAVADAWIWSASYNMANRATDAVFGPRTFRVEHTAAATTSASSAAGVASSPSNPCQIHAMAFQDCIDNHGSDISKCQFYVNLLNDCRRRGQVAVVETS